MTSHQSRLVITTVVAGFLMAESIIANAALVTSDTISSPVVIDFSTQATVSNVAGPIQIGSLVGQDVTVQTVDGSSALYTNFNGWGLINNGTWNAPQTYVSFNQVGGLRFSFNSGPVAQVGGFMNYAIGGSPTHLIITALDAGLNVLETYDITNLADIVTPAGANAGAFRGIVRPTADIAFFEVSANDPVLDNLTFSSNGGTPTASSIPVPTMSIYALALTTVGLLLVATRRLSQSFKRG
jgi:hypothetical protein